MINKPLLTAAALWFLMGAAAQAQAQLDGQGQYLHADAVQLWRNTQNTASLALDSSQNRGYAEFRYDHRSGDYRRVQEGGVTNALSFYTERYQQVGRYLQGYGRFHFRNGRTQNRAWSDVMRTYGSNPFLSGSAVPARYGFQDFDLTARLGTVNLNGWYAGVGLDYRVGDLSRLRDPRSRSQLLDYKMTPSVSRRLGAHTLGLAGWYRRYKEKIPNISTVQNDPNLVYYQMTGLEAATGTIGGYSGFSREYVNHAFGAELQYGWQHADFRTLNTLSIERGAEDVLEQYKRQPGKYYSYIYKVGSQNRIERPGLVHQIDVEASFGQAYADEFRPQLVITVDSVRGYTSRTYINAFTYRKRFQQERIDLGVDYWLHFRRRDEVVRQTGVQARWASLRQKHLLPQSTFQWQTLELDLTYGQALLRNRRLWVEATTGFRWSAKARLNLADATGPYAQSVLLRDMDYYAANYWQGTLSVRYQFPLTFKNYRALAYVRGQAQTLRAQRGQDATAVALTLGLFN